VADALVRPALQVAQPQRSVLMGASQAGGRLVAVGERGVIVGSDDGGRSWQQGQVPLSVSLTAVQMLDAKVGFAVGHSAVVLATNDGGKTWRKLTDGVQLAALALQTAKAAGDAQALQKAEQLVSDGPDKPLLCLYFFDARRGMVLGSYNLAFSTQDGGQSWTSMSDRLDNPKGLHLYAVSARGQALVIAGEQGLVFRSDDGGQSFKRLSTPYKGSFFTADLPTDDEVVLAGLRGNAWRSLDRGQSWSLLPVPAPVSFVASTTPAGQRTVLANQAGQLFALSDTGLTALPAAAAPPLNSLLALSGGGLLVLGGSGASLLPAAHTGAKP